MYRPTVSSEREHNWVFFSILKDIHVYAYSIYHISIKTYFTIQQHNITTSTMPCCSERFNEIMFVKYFFICHISQLFWHTDFIRTSKRSTSIHFHFIAIVYTFIVNHGHPFVLLTQICNMQCTNYLSDDSGKG